MTAAPFQAYCKEAPADNFWQICANALGSAGTAGISRTLRINNLRVFNTSNAFDSDPRLHSKPVKSPMVKEPLPPQAGGKRRVMTIFPITNAQTADNGKTTKNVTMVNGVAS